MRYLLLLFIVMPIIEMWLLITVGREIGAFPTIGLVLLTAAVGFSLLRQQGFATLFRARQKMDAGELPAIEMVEAIILAVCGALLMTPGFVTDVIGFAGLVSGLRRWIVMRLATQMNVVSYSEHEVRCRDHGGDSDADFQTLEGESWREDDDSPVEK
ncbi:MAG: FxsA family protein [Porticoccus sp.]